MRIALSDFRARPPRQWTTGALLLLCCGVWSPGWAASEAGPGGAVRSAPDVLGSDAAIEALRAQGELVDTVIAGDLDLARLAPTAPTEAGAPGYARQGAADPPTYRLERVRVDGDVVLLGGALPARIEIIAGELAGGILFENCTLDAFALRDAVVVSGPVLIRACTIKGPARFDRTRFLGPVRLHGATFTHRVSFAGAVFRERAEFTGCEFATEEFGEYRRRAANSFSETHFFGPALFDETVFHTPARFQGTLFDDDASFLKTQMPVGGNFANAHFLGDAEFRFCRFGPVRFSSADHLTLFAGRADFRGCIIDQACFDYAELRGTTSLVDAHFGAWGASFRHASLSGRADFNGLSSDGPLNLARAYLPKLDFRWRDLRDAVIAAEPDERTLETLRVRAEALGDRAGRLQLEWLRKRREFADVWAEPLPPVAAEPARFIDRAAERGLAGVEWMVWGLPTGYGTKLGRILLLALLLWLLAAVPAGLARGLLAHGLQRRSDDADHSCARPAYEPTPLRCLGAAMVCPVQLAARMQIALAFGLRLLFKVGGEGVAFVAEDPSSPRIRRWRHWFRAQWLLGPVLLLLIALTLANTSPIINSLIGELFPT